MLKAIINLLQGTGCLTRGYGLSALVGFIYGFQTNLSHALVYGFLAGSVWLALFVVTFLFVGIKENNDELHI